MAAIKIGSEEEPGVNTEGATHVQGFLFPDSVPNRSIPVHRGQAPACEAQPFLTEQLCGLQWSWATQGKVANKAKTKCTPGVKQALQAPESQNSVGRVT